MTCPNCQHRWLEPQVVLDPSPGKILEQLRFGSSVLTSEILQSMNSALEGISDCNVQISSLEPVLDFLKQRREEFHTYINRCRSLEAPIRRIPPEVLTEIFLACCSELNYFPEANWIDAHIPALTLAAVCKNWRDVALSTPRIWAGIACSSNILSTRLLYAFDLCLRRSKDAPLVLNLEVTFHRKQDSALRALVGQSHRWSSLRLYRAYHDDAISPLSSIYAFPLLEKLEICGPVRLFELIMPGLKNAPRLNTLQIMKYRLNEPFSQTLVQNLIKTVPWAQIRSLEMEFMEGGSAMRFLRMCPALVNLSISSPGSRVPSADTLTLASLLSLDLSFVDFRGQVLIPELSSTLDHLTLPALKSLTLSPPLSTIHFNSNNGVLWPLDQFADFFSRSQCCLTSFYVHNVPISDETLVAFLCFMPSLTNLKINQTETAITPAVTDFSLTSMHHSPGIIPSLKYLSITVHTATFIPGVFISMVRSRWTQDQIKQTENVECLKFVKLIVLDDRDDLDVEGVYKSILSLGAEGLTVEVIYGSDF